MNLKKTLSLSLIPLLVMSVLATLPLLASPSENIYLDDLPSSTTYVIRNSGATYWAIRYDGKVLWEGSNDDTTIQNAIDQTTTSGGIVFIQEGTYSASVTVKSNVLLLLDYGTSGVSYTLDGTGIALYYANGVVFHDFDVNMTGHQIIRGLFHSGTTAERIALSPTQGQPFWDTTLKALYVYNGTAWDDYSTYGGASHVAFQDYSYLIYEDGGTYYAKNGTTEQVDFSNANAYPCIQNVLDNLTSGGTIYLSGATYTLGANSQIDDCESNWTPADVDISCALDTDNQEGTYSINTTVGIDFTTGLACYHDISSVDLSDYGLIGFWLRPSVDITGVKENPTTSTLSIRLDDSAGCGSPLKTLKIGHPESSGWGGNWKWVTCSLGDASGLTSIQSIGMQIDIDEGAWDFLIDDICVFKDHTLRPLSDTRITGDKQAIITQIARGNIPLFQLGNVENVELSNIELDGNLDNQDRIDHCIGIYLSRANNCTFFNLYVHDTKGGGIKLVESKRNKILACSLENIENPAIELSAYASGYDTTDNEIISNTIRNILNDDGIWLHANCRGNLIEANHIWVNATTRNGIRLAGGGASYGVSWNTVMGNYIEQCDIGIQVGGGGGTDEFNSFVGNTIRVHETNGIWLFEGSHNSVTGNVIDGAGGGYYSIKIESSVTYSVVMVNVCGDGVDGSGGTGCIIGNNTTT